MRKILSILCILGILSNIIASSPVLAANTSLSIMGAITCKDWVKNRINDTEADALGRLVSSGDKSWLLGFLSGLNINGQYDKDVLDAVDVGTISLWTDRYCKHNPKSDLSDAGIELFSELKNIHN